MSDHVTKRSHDEEAMSRTSSHTGHPSWMSHWIKRSSKPTSAVNDSSLICYKGGHVDHRGSRTEGRLKLEDNFSRSGKGIMNKGVEEVTTGIMNENLKEKSRDFQNKISNPSFPTLKLYKNAENTSALRTQDDNKFGHKSMSLALAVDKPDISSDFNLRSREQRVVSHLYQEHKDIAVSRSSVLPHGSSHANASRPVIVFEKHFSNDNFTCFGEDQCKYQKSSSFLFHAKKMENNLSRELRQSDQLYSQLGPNEKKNFLPFFLKKQSQEIPNQPLERAPCSFRNVETMRICTMVDSLEDSPGDAPKISQRAHHFLFTKETCLNLSKGHQVFTEPPLTAHHDENVEKTFDESFNLSPDVSSSYPRGVKIQPLWTSTDSEEKENTGNLSICKAGCRNEASAETDGTLVEAPKNRHILSGMELSPLNKDDALDENSRPAPCDSTTEKARSQRPVTEIPDINKKLPTLQTAVSSTDGKEPSTSRVHSLNAKHLFPCGEQTSRSECNAPRDHPFGPGTSNRWIKRLKLDSSDSFGVGTKRSDIGEGSSPEKFSTFFSRMMKTNGESSGAKLSKHHGKEHMAIDQNVDSLQNDESSSMGSKKRNQSMMLGCSWIQRWCQNCTAPQRKNPEPLVICEPQSLKFGQDELAKKQFPSIAAMALMGKTMNGFRSCEFSKRGPVVVWNTKEY